MPVCYITLSEKVKFPNDEQLENIRKSIADGLFSSSKYLDKDHIVLRIQHSKRKHMLGEVELDIFAQFYIKRFFNRDKRANKISHLVSEILDADCATWINLSVVGYSRVTTKGEVFYSD